MFKKHVIFPILSIAAALWRTLSFRSCHFKGEQWQSSSWKYNPCCLNRRTSIAWGEFSQKNLVRCELLQEDNSGDLRKSWREGFGGYREWLPAWLYDFVFFTLCVNVRERIGGSKVLCFCDGIGASNAAVILAMPLLIVECRVAIWKHTVVQHYEAVCVVRCINKQKVHTDGLLLRWYSISA